MNEHETDKPRGRDNDRNDSSGSGFMGPEVRSDSGRQAVPRGQNGRRRGGGLHLGLRGVDQVNHWQVLDEIAEAIRELNQTLKNKL
jgi:hypothetical protein